MGRPVVLSNGELFVGLDESGLVHDFYYPYVGLENLTNARSTQHKIGLWVDGQFSWTDDGSWQIQTIYDADNLIGKVIMNSTGLALTVETRDYIDPTYNALIRNINITNHSDISRDIRLFMHQVFQLSHAGRGDTAMYVPDAHYVLDYKGSSCLAIAGKISDGTAFDQYAVGNYGIEGKAGTYLDAPDGELSGNAVEHGGVDSVIRFRQQVSAGANFTVDYWIVAAANQTDAQKVHNLFKEQPMLERLEAARSYWAKWVDDSEVDLPSTHRRELIRSLLTIKAHCDRRGSVLASGDSSIFNYGRDYYCYCWPRDAAYALWPLIRLGHYDEAKAFFEFANDTVHPDGYLLHKYQPDRAIGSTWHPLVHNRQSELAIQEDETAGVVYMINEFYESSRDADYAQGLYESFVINAAEFMCGFIDEATGLPHASYDLWEQKFSTSTYTVCITIGALEAAAKLAKLFHNEDRAIRWLGVAAGIRSNLEKLYHPDGYYRKGLLLLPDGTIEYDDTLDISSLYGPYMYARLPLDHPTLLATADHVEKLLLNTSPIGGVIRYPGDDYFLAKRQYGGNPWIVCSLWLAQYYASTAQTEKAQQLLDWALARQLPSGILSEQFDPDDGAPLGVTPLVWSHAEMVNTILDLASQE